MKESEVAAIWNLVRDRLKQRVSSTTYSVWIESLALRNYEQGLLKLEVPTVWHRQFLSSRLDTVIQACLSDVGLEPAPKIKFILREGGNIMPDTNCADWLDHLVYLEGPSQRRYQQGKDTSAGVVVALHPTGQESHIEIRRIRHEEGETDIVDSSIFKDAGVILQVDKGSYAICKDLWDGNAHYKVPISAITTAGWCQVLADPFIGETHWMPGAFQRGSEDRRYYFGPDDREDQFKVAVQGFVITPVVADQLAEYGIQVQPSVYS